MYWQRDKDQKCIIDKNAKLSLNILLQFKTMLLDTQAMKTILIEIPSLIRLTSTAASYSKFVIVSREIKSALVAYCPPSRFSESLRISFHNVKNCLQIFQMRPCNNIIRH
ncbi:BnaC02g44660D [Brassica napus]|uniref:BnaC02g44660D protein n=1 Tax=Brassica napus TaxID=3708 RepID=A0A078IMC9_BRANA|nr:BnaC02g44660D [Brassica napus]